MLFITAFEKVADLSRHSDGSEFKISDNEPMAHSPSLGGMAPSGMETYENLAGKGRPLLRTRKQRLQVLMYPKYAQDMQGIPDSISAGASGGGMDTANAVSEQLKYEGRGDMKPDQSGYSQAAKLRRKKK